MKQETDETHTARIVNSCNKTFFIKGKLIGDFSLSLKKVILWPTYSTKILIFSDICQLSPTLY